MSGALDRVAARLGGLVERDVPIGPLTTYRVGGAADLFAVVTSVAELHSLAEAVADERVPVLVVGRGSNLLVSDAGFRGSRSSSAGEFESVTVAGTTLISWAGRPCSPSSPARVPRPGSPGSSGRSGRRARWVGPCG